MALRTTGQKCTHWEGNREKQVKIADQLNKEKIGWPFKNTKLPIFQARIVKGVLGFAIVVVLQ